MAMAASDTPANVTGGKGQLNTTYISGRVDEVCIPGQRTKSTIGGNKWESIKKNQN